MLYHTCIPMLILETLLLIGILLELLLLVPFMWKFRVLTILFTSCLHVLAIFLILVSSTNVFMLLGVFALVFRLINNARILVERKHHHHLKQVTLRTALYLIIFQCLAWLGVMFEALIAAETLLLVLTVGQFSVAVAFLSWIAGTIHQTSYHGHEKFFTEKELPTLTVAIPARNETEDLGSCIESIVASNYPKLEILVLDDCSQDKTPEVIKQYAHAGVRFLQGTPPPDGWLAKNHAYAQLAAEASGALIMFCGVDVRMSPDFLRKLVTHLKVKKKRMISVLPMRLGGDLRSSFVQPMRYWWELALPRRFTNKPAALSTCWLIDHKALKNLGGFSAVKRSILPERYFARENVKHDCYSFIRANELLDLRTTKTPEHQLQTALRVRYPQLHNRPENVFLVTLGMHLFLFMPYVLFVASFFISMPAVQLFSGLSLIFLTLSHLFILSISNPTNTIFGLINFPVVILTDIFLTVFSMLRYEFGQMIWKGRNVCIPAFYQSEQIAREQE